MVTGNGSSINPTRWHGHFFSPLASASSDVPASRCDNDANDDSVINYHRGKYDNQKDH